MSRLSGMLRGVLVSTLVAVMLGCLVLGVLYREHVILEPGEHISRESIESVIAQESPVYYADGRTRLGVFFSREHREHVRYSEIPDAWVQAITASEDKRFWDHFGVDVWGIARAMLKNVLSGRVVAGGSTLTQQTAKNLYYRPDRSLSSKLQELVNALRLEAHYSKEEILEFYANQFHVSANGRGLGIASRYFFDRDVAELGVQECAFLAGLVKAPARYNPFVGSTPEARDEAREKAQHRMVLVLGRMLDEGHIDEETFQEFSERPLPFKKGTFRYASSVMLDEVERRLSLPPFPQLFEDAGIDNPSTAGIQVVTTLDESIQRSAIYGLQHHLSEVGPLLEGLDPKDLLLDGSLAPKPDPNRGLHPQELRIAKVVSADAKTGVMLDLGGFDGKLDKTALDRVSRLIARGKAGNRWAKPTAAHRAALLGVLSPGAVVRVSVRERPENGPALCDLELTPELQGAMVILEKGRLRAMVGGSRNQDFNRAVAARRQLGSTWKPLLLHAALQLGWTVTDKLDNRRTVFPFEGSFYAPNPDHEPDPFVSLAWSSVRSENLASIWLLFHLVDQLDDEQLIRVATVTDLAPRVDEKRRDYIRRIRDDLGVIATRDRMNAVLFSRVGEGVSTDLAFSGVPDVEVEARELRSLYYGLGFSKERAAVELWDSGPEREERLRALESSFLHLEKQAARCRESLEPRNQDDESVMEGTRFSVLETDEGEQRFYCGRSPAGAELFGLVEESEPDLDSEPDPELEPGLEPEEDVEAPLQKLQIKEEMAIEPVQQMEAIRPQAPEDFLVDGRVHDSTLRAIRTAMDAARPTLSNLDPYDVKALIHHPDFRVLLAVRYVAALANRLGATTEIPPVLSLPLGAVDLSIEEMAGIYQGLLTGLAWRFPGTAFDSGEVAGLRSSRSLDAIGESHLLIHEIRDRHGNVMYRADEIVEEVVDAQVGALVEDVLANVVRHGTARRSAALLEGIDAGGKTGTTNGFRNAAFVGYARGSEREFFVSTYVGYDDNRSMVRGNTKLHGASGALPAWTLAVGGLADSGVITRGEVSTRSEYTRIDVDPAAGLPVNEPVAGGPSIRVPVAENSRRFVPLVSEQGSFTGTATGPRNASIWDEIAPSSQ